MDIEAIIKSVRSVDSFHKKCLLLFDDIVSAINEKTLTDEISSILLEGGYWVGINESEHQRQYIFKHDNRIRFVCMFVKIKESKLRTKSSGFKKVCHELEINPVYPFLIAFGLFQPRDNERFLADLYLRRNWIDNIVLLGMPDDIIQSITRSTSYEFGKLLKIETPLSTDSWYCEKSQFILQNLIEVKDSHGVESIADKLLNIEKAAQPGS